jgi:hypothetical protein
MKGLECVCLVCVCVCCNRSQHVLESNGHMVMRFFVQQSNTHYEHALTIPVHSNMTILEVRVIEAKVLNVVDWVG